MTASFDLHPITDLLLIGALGFVGSFGHCAGMCGPLVTAFAVGQPADHPVAWPQQVRFHLLLNFGRILSYGLVGGAIGSVGSLLVAGGQLAGIGSGLRQLMTMVTGLVLIGMGLRQIYPQGWPRLPLLHPLLQAQWHQRLTSGMVNLSLRPQWWTPAFLGMIWGLIPCGFLYTAQIKAAETGSFWLGSLTVLAFGLGTLPTMTGVGLSTSLLSADRRSQLFRSGGWLTLIIGVVTLFRSSEMVDLTGHAALLCLMLALIARPISRLWAQPLRYRRVLGVGSAVLALAHTGHMLDHTLLWNWGVIPFLLPHHQWAMGSGIVGLLLLWLAAATSFDRAMQRLGSGWRKLHLLTLPALGLSVVHALLIGSSYGGDLEVQTRQWIAIAVLVSLTLGVFLVRCQWAWGLCGRSSYYAAAQGQRDPAIKLPPNPANRLS